LLGQWPIKVVNKDGGKDTLARRRAKIAAFEKEINEWQGRHHRHGPRA
jgi:hypothetical protein